MDARVAWTDADYDSLTDAIKLGEVERAEGICDKAPLADDEAYEPLRPLPEPSVLSPLDGLPLRFGCEFTLVGCKYGDRKSACLRAMPGDSVDFVREPDNEHDANAIRVEHSGDDLGHVPGELAKILAPVLDAGARATGRVLWQIEKTTTGKEYVSPRIWILIYSRDRHPELGFVGDVRAWYNIFTNRDENIPERNFYLPDDDVSGRHRKGDVIVTSDETIMVGVVKGVEPGVLVVPDGVCEIATGAGSGVTAGGLLLPESLETIRQFAFPDAGNWRVRIPAGVSLIESGAFYGGTVSRKEWSPCYFEVDAANERYFSEGGNLLEHSGGEVYLLNLFYDIPDGKRFSFGEGSPDPGYDLRIPEGVTTLDKYCLTLGSSGSWTVRALLPKSFNKVVFGSAADCGGTDSVNLFEDVDFAVGGRRGSNVQIYTAEGMVVRPPKDAAKKGGDAR